METLERVHCGYTSSNVHMSLGLVSGIFHEDCEDTDCHWPSRQFQIFNGQILWRRALSNEHAEVARPKQFVDRGYRTTSTLGLGRIRGLHFGVSHSQLEHRDDRFYALEQKPEPQWQAKSIRTEILLLSKNKKKQSYLSDRPRILKILGQTLTACWTE